MTELKWYGEKAKKVAREAAKIALQTCAADLKGKSSRQAPIDTGDLRANCDVDWVKQEDENLQIKVFYNLPYAIVQHEHLEFRHPKGGKAKYLEDPFNENKSKYISDIKSAVKRALGSG